MQGTATEWKKAASINAPHTPPYSLVYTAGTLPHPTHTLL